MRNLKQIATEITTETLATGRGVLDSIMDARKRHADLNLPEYSDKYDRQDSVILDDAGYDRDGMPLYLEDLDVSERERIVPVIVICCCGDPGCSIGPMEVKRS